MRYLVFQELKPMKGIRYSKVHIGRLMKKRQFPAAVKGLGKEDCWPEDQIDNYIADRAAAAADSEEETTA